MAQEPDEFYARVTEHTDSGSRLPRSRMTRWEIFPFEPDGLTVVRLLPPELPEPPRWGEDGRECLLCSREWSAVWADDHWRLRLFPDEPSGAPLILVLEPTGNYDLPDLPDDMARELGLLTVGIARAIEALPHIARAHVARWGDGGAHLHVLFFARPAGFPQLRGTCFAVWDDLLPPVPDEVRSTDAAAVARALTASYGGNAA